MTQRTDISSVESQDDSILATFNPGLDGRVRKRDVRYAGEEYHPSSAALADCELHN